MGSMSISLSSSLFFGRTRSSCRTNRDCPRLTSSGGRCLDRSNGLCGLANIFRRNKENCSYKTCGQCVNDVDCAGDSYCSGFFCVQRYTPPTTTPNYGYNPSYDVNPYILQAYQG